MAETNTDQKDPLWYKDAVIYEVHVRAFQDSNADGIGDFRGLTQRLDYLEDLGITAIWLLPFYPSPLKDDGYDIADYYSINPIYGTLADFQEFLRASHDRGLRVITELVVNHTSDQHPWFQKSRRARPGDPWRDFYVWSDSTSRYQEARIIFRDFELSNWTLDPIANAYYWHRFYSHQPDLNYDNPRVHAEIQKVLDFWLDMGVDGLRLDAVPYLYEREGTSCENLKETHAYLKTLRRHVDEKYGDRMLIAEANQWPEDAVTYFGEGKGDECHMAFHFPLMPRIFMSVRMEDRVPVVDILEQTPAIPETSQWALFLRNHDELTLEMVTDEERDYMYRVYANDAKARINLGIRRRLAPLLGNDRKRIELLNLLLLAFPGTPVLYYGDEIGMGDNIFLGDRNGVRTPMQWSSDKNAGFSRASPHALYLPIILDPESHYEAINVEAQQRNPSSLLWWTKRALALRKRYRAFGRGSLKFLQPENRKVLAFIRHYQGESLLVVANLSRFSQPVWLDLAEFDGSIPVELFGGTEFPKITRERWFLTLSPHAALWFALQPATTETPAPGEGQAPLEATETWEELISGGRRASLEQALSRAIRTRRLFAGEFRRVKSAQIPEVIPIPYDSQRAFIVVVTVDYTDGESEEYLLPVAFATGPRKDAIERNYPQLIIASVTVRARQESGVLYDALASPEFCEALLRSVAGEIVFRGEKGSLGAAIQPTAPLLIPRASQARPGHPNHANTSAVYANEYWLKLFRRVEPGKHPDLELGQFLTERQFPHIAPVGGALEYQRLSGDPITFCLVTRFFPECKDAWEFTMDTLSRYYERVRTTPRESIEGLLAGSEPVFELAAVETPEAVLKLVGTYLEAARLLGRRTAELHVTLASAVDLRDLAPEKFTPFYQRGLYQSMRNQVVNCLQQLKHHLGTLPPGVEADAQTICASEKEILCRLRGVYESPMDASRIRCHGNLHLGEILYTGKDFIFLDFEGEPMRPMGERRIKSSPLRDVAAMLRSFDYIAWAALWRQLELGAISQAQIGQFSPWAQFWQRWAGAVYLRAYLQSDVVDLLPKHSHQLDALLRSYLITKALSEIAYELHRRPHLLPVPIKGLVRLLQEEAQPAGGDLPVRS